jgi:antitoxin component YwqK of YwqJK toxin-antitoxin module
MKRFSMLFAFIFFTICSVYSQDIKEIDGVYYKGSTPYTGKYFASFENGKPKIEINLIDGLKDGVTKVYFETGELNEIRSYKKNIMDGDWFTYNENKIKVAEAHYLDGKKNGKWYIWDENGTLIYELEYTSGKKTGIWKNYDTTGKLINERSYLQNEK